ncbi:MAG TPA: thiamine phosphate synthase [Myxococcaceae bacterium]|nr:thiamine phosphate synthase [Myxococcaceae bacterium]
MTATLLPAGLYALCDDTLGVSLPVPEQARALVSGGARVIQVRLKRTSTRQAIAWIREVVGICHAAGTRCLVNDRVDWCLVGGADGVHLGDDDLPVDEARRLLGPTALIGATVRNGAQTIAAREQGADHVGMGPLFGTQSKQVDAPVLGLEAFAREVAASVLPVVGIGGITLERIASVAAAGAHAAAVLSDPLTADDVTARARALAVAFEKGRTAS